MSATEASSFNGLPYELRREIFSLVLCSTQPRIVEIFIRDGEIYSKAPPPALLHVCQMSRFIPLQHYKSWLPLFKGRKCYRAWQALVESEEGKRDLSRLQNVCVHLEHDILFINKKPWSDWSFVILERKYLRSLAINLGGWQQWTSS